jgi:uncharacterized membrane protein
MMDHLATIAILAAALGCGLVAGIFFAFSSFVMSGLARLPAPQGIAAMPSINVTAVTPGFMTTLFGTALLSIGLAIAALSRWPVPGATYLLAGCALYVVGAILVTMLCNVPRNSVLAALDPGSADAARIWPGYVVEWTAWNHLRAAAALAAAVCFILALS